ncbi:carbohydrate ABC transporter permease [Silicimonas sp. MF1-12-2]|uniref:carbohydrate ABC transporter permease n=1 Tax=Silicimonas sp. MF1-12-2 TaxID=3384793 RepID=UPI0039B3836D
MTPRFSPVPAVFTFLIILPIYWLIAISLQTPASVAGTLRLIPSDLTLENFRFILSEPDWYWGYVNAVIYVSMNVVISVGVALPAAYAFSRFRFRGRRVLFFSLLMFRMMVPAILLVPFVQIFSALDMIDTYIAVALAHCFFSVPIAIWILEGFISGIPVEIDESAQADGYGTLRFFQKVLLPMIAPGAATAAFFCFMFSWVEFLLSNALTTIDAKPFGGIMSRVGSVMSGHIPLMAAAGVLGLVPGVVLAILMRRHLAQGFSMGRVS